MNKQKRISQKRTSNIFDMMKDRELCFDGGYEKSPWQQNSEFQSTNRVNKRFSYVKAKDLCNDDQIKQMTRAQMIKYLRAYKTNYELLSFVLQPKFRPPPQVLPVIEPKPTKSKPHSFFSKAKTDQGYKDIRASQLSRPSTSSSTTLRLGRRKSVCFQSTVKCRSSPYPNPYPLKAAHNCTSFPRKMRCHGISQPSGSSRHSLRGKKKALHYFNDEHEPEVFYDVESSSRSY